MKTKINLTLAATLALAASLHTVHAQGSLTPPPGVPAPVMKTLDQVEARTPLVAGQPGVTINGAGTITISQRGSYYLTGNVTITTSSANGITITADQVTVDLNGFSLICTGVNGGNAVDTGSRTGTRVRNGSIVGGTTWNGSIFTLAGWNNGIHGSGSNDVRVSDVTVRGVRNFGIYAYYIGGFVERCSVNVCGNYGIYSSNVIDCTVRNAGSHAIYTTSGIDAGVVDNCFGECVAATGDGIRGIDGIISNSRGISVGGFGVFADQAINCNGNSTSGTGLAAKSATNCRGVSSSGTGLTAELATNSIGQSTSGSFGMSIGGTASFCQGMRNGGVAISAPIAIGCTVSGTGTITSAQKHLGTP